MILQSLFLGSAVSGVYATQPMCGVYATRLSVRLCQSAAVCASMPVSSLLGVYALQHKSPPFPWQYVGPWDAADHAHSFWSKSLRMASMPNSQSWRRCHFIFRYLQSLMPVPKRTRRTQEDPGGPRRTQGDPRGPGGARRSQQFKGT